MSEASFARVSLVDARAPARAFSPLRARGVDNPAPAAAAAPDEPDPYVLGFAAGELAAGEAFARERDELLRLLAAAQVFQPEPCEELAVMIATTVERLVTGLVDVMPVGADWLTARIAHAVSHIADADAARTLWLHPDDIALLGDEGPPLETRPDPTLERGALRIDCSHGWIEDSRSLHLDALRATLGIEVRS